ncbi:MAG: helix-turn-helix domain-containing protein [Saprospiraceae bacterium]|nr:helix-turn-helix domain-containing protein [Saprospiraceae bacterium]
MKILSFNTDAGIYSFELEQLEAGWHAHPAMEVIIASGSNLQLETNDKLFTDVAFAIIDANVNHKVYSDHPVRLWMIEGSISSLNTLYDNLVLPLRDGVFVKKVLGDEKYLDEWLANLPQEQKFGNAVDPRVQICLDYFRKKEIQYPKMMQSLQAQTHLSDSRLSHIFKQEMGLSLKKYLVWSRLRETLQYVLSDQMSLYEAGLRSGFYDQAHLSKAFKQMLGLSPSKVYNSRTIQE